MDQETVAYLDAILAKMQSCNKGNRREYMRQVLDILAREATEEIAMYLGILRRTI